MVRLSKTVRLLPPVEVRAVFKLRRPFSLADIPLDELASIMVNNPDFPPEFVEGKPEFSKLPVLLDPMVPGGTVYFGNLAETAARLHAHCADGSTFWPEGKERAFLCARLYKTMRPCYCTEAARPEESGMITELANAG